MDVTLLAAPGTKLFGFGRLFILYSFIFFVLFSVSGCVVVLFYGFVLFMVFYFFGLCWGGRMDISVVCLFI